MVVSEVKQEEFDWPQASLWEFAVVVNLLWNCSQEVLDAVEKIFRHGNI